MWRDFDDGHFHPVTQEAARRLQAQQSSADHRSSLAMARIGGDVVAVFQRPKNEHPLLVGSFDGGNKGPGARGQDQRVERLFDFPTSARHDAPGPVDFFGLDPDVNGHSVFLIPLERIDPELLGVLETT